MRPKTNKHLKDLNGTSNKRSLTGDEIVKILDFKATQIGNRIVLTRKLSTGKWELAGVHHWESQSFLKRNGSTAFKSVLCGPYPELTKQYLKRN